MCTTCSELVVIMYWTGKSMNNILSYCGLVDVKINTSDKDLPVINLFYCVTDRLHNTIVIISDSILEGQCQEKKCQAIKWLSSVKVW